MNFPKKNLDDLKVLKEMAENDNPLVKITSDAAKQGMKMKAALEMVLSFHDPEAWTSERDHQWYDLQRAAGVENVKQGASTRTLCDTIREVLGLKMEEYKEP